METLENKILHTYILKIKWHDLLLPYLLFCVIASNTCRRATPPGKNPNNLYNHFAVVINKGYWTVATL